MTQLDLFGNVYPDKTFEEEYREYITSTAWKSKREQTLKRAGYKCEVCGFSKWSAKLEVHHLTYERFKNERLEDLMVVCEKCHKQKDQERKLEVQRKRADRLYEAQLDGWASKVFGEDWDYDYAAERFEQWLEDQ